MICTGDDTHSNNSIFFPCILSSLNSYNESSALVIFFSWPGHLHSSIWSVSKNTQLTSWGWTLLLQKNQFIYWDLESQVKTGHKKRKNPILILRLAEVWSTFLRNYIIKYCLAVQRKNDNAVTETHLCANHRNTAWELKLQLILRFGFGAGSDHGTFYSSFFNTPSPRGCSQLRATSSDFLSG